MTTTNTNSTIRAIDKSSVHRICAGQVISDLPGCVKELVENSLDANALSVEVRFSTEIGGLMLESLSVIEALSSLCAVAGGLVVVTRVNPDVGNPDESVGVKLEYDSHGVLISSEPAARERGTTITIKNLFATLPVRLREFKKNFKRELNKCIDLLHAFALVSVNVRITAVSQSAKSGRSVLVSTCGNPTIKLNMSNVFGAKSLPTLLEVDFSVSTSSQATTSASTSKKMDLDSESNSQNDSSQGDSTQEQEQLNGEDVDEEELNSPDNRTINVKGLVSRPMQNFGRTSNDRQFFYINNRPCDLPKLAKVVNEVYKTYNSHQYPVIVWNLIMEPDMYDVNVSPNKRTIFLHNERIVFENIKYAYL
ncbi:UNVERIFIED_CONTAM: hypothetical protein HDU68_009060 [Siphonaria sp. JEL0065]|nr:hypothetical protein HDU68_009060 [Siphonaria sp. JEL0065]